MNIYDERIKRLQERMKKEGVKAYLIPCTDPQMSEECCETYRAERLYYCPFDAESGTLLVTEDSYYLYTDGRFWLAAEEMLKGTSCVLMRDGKPGVLSYQEFICKNDLFPVAFDYSLFSLKEAKSFERLGEIRDCSFIDAVEDLPALPQGKIWKVDEDLLSTTREERVNALLSALPKNTSVAITALDATAYVLGYRGSDLPCTPLFYSYLFIEENGKIHLFIDEKKLPEDFPSEIAIHPLDSFYSFLERREEKIAVDLSKVNAKLIRSIRDLSDVSIPVETLKSIKGPREIQNSKEVQIIDGYAVLKLMKFVDDHIEEGFDEYQAAQYIDQQRLSHQRCFDLSFPTIAAVDSNAAMMHYGPTAEKRSKVTKENMLLLVDSGGQYYGGTTDTTRTFILRDDVPYEVKHDYTITLKSQIHLTDSIFMKRCSGHILDIKAREIFWREGLDYKCGTGHGVGYMSCVHEGPIGFRYYSRAGVMDQAPLTPGQVITVEPGVYKDHKYGIRLENDLLVIPSDIVSDQGEFLTFETITYAPYDRRGILVDELTDREIEWFNSYSKKVFETLAPLCEDQEILDYLKKVTAPLKRHE